MTTPLRIAGLISGGGRTLVNILDAIEDERLPAALAVAIASRPGAAGVERLRVRGVDVRIIDRADHASDEAMHDAIDETLASTGADLVALCGYLRHFRIAPERAGRVVNIHPALLPEFGGPGMYGLHVHRAVLESGRRVSGCTVHFVDEEYDHGPIILQRECPVRADDTAETLAARVFLEECVAYPEALRLIAEGAVRLEGDRVVETHG